MLALTPSALLISWEAASAASHVTRGAALVAAATGLAWDEACSLPLGELARRIFRLRHAHYGDAVTALATCPKCADTIEIHFRTTDFTSHASPQNPLFIEAKGLRLDLRLPATSDLCQVTGEDAPDSAAKHLLRLCLLSARDASGQPVPPEAILNNPETTSAAEQAIALADPHADIRLGLACPHCQTEWETPFDPASFLLQELDAEATRHLRDVHDIALAYGWSESDIMTLSPCRRAAYLNFLRS